MAIRLPGYRITERLGKGGMAHVFLATQHSFERQVAIKILSPSLALEPSFAERFMQEARTVASLNHPHIVPVYDVGEHEGYYYLSMEYVTGGSLKQRIRDGMEPRQAETVLRQLAGALDYAGQHGFIHRDVKPDNVMFRADGSALLMDFGIAANILRDTSVTGSTSVMGTPKYMSPEQHRRQPLTPQSDLYSLGCVFYEMLTGKPPYTGDDASAMAQAHQREPIPLLPVKLSRYSASYWPSRPRTDHKVAPPLPSCSIIWSHRNITPGNGPATGHRKRASTVPWRLACDSRKPRRE